MVTTEFYTLSLHDALPICGRHYIDGPYMDSKTPDVEWKKVSAELLILSLVEARPRHGYEISKLIERRSGGAVRFYVRSEEHTSELQSRPHLVCRLLLEKKK